MIPQNEPQLVSRATVPASYYIFYNRPFPMSDQMLLSCGEDNRSASWEPIGKPCVVLLAIDRETLNEAYRVEVLGKTDIIYAGLPAALLDGSLLLPVYQRDYSLRILLIDQTGTIQNVDEIGGEDIKRLHNLRIIGNDGANKLHLGPIIPVTPNAYLFSWIYRDIKFHRIEYRRVGQQDCIWSEPEWILGWCDQVVITGTMTEPYRSYNYHINARQMETGKLLWSLEALDKFVAAVTDQATYIVDRSGRAGARGDDERAASTAEGNHEAVPAESDTFPEEREEGVESSDQGASILIALDSRSGEEIWRTSLDGDVVSFVTGPDHLHLMMAEEGRRGRLVGLTREGEIVWQMPVEQCAEKSPSTAGAEHFGRPDAHLWPALIDCDEHTLLWATCDKLIATDLEQTGRVLWQIDLPNRCLNLRVRYMDRYVNETSISVADGAIWMRNDDELWVYSNHQS